MNNSVFLKINPILNELKLDNNIIAIYLFGSQATNKNKSYSDIDICLILKNNDKAIDYLGYSGKYIDISVFDKLPLTAKYKVFKEGKLLFVSNKAVLDEIKIRVLRDYLDNKYYLDLGFEYFLNKEGVKFE